MNERLTFAMASPESSPEGGALFSQMISKGLESQDISLSIRAVQWEQLWHLTQTETMNSSSIDVSEVGSTWIESLIDVNAIRPFSEEEISQLGGKEMFSKSAWQGAGYKNKDEIFSVPWLTDVRVIYFWEDILSAAGLNEPNAFSTPALCERTIGILHEKGMPTWGTPTYRCMNTVHHMASWIWANGKDFISRDGKRIELYDQEAIHGIASYFKLSSYMNRTFESLSELKDSFRQREVAAVMDGPWLLRHLLTSIKDPKILSNLRLTLPPGQPFLGGSNLVIWSGIKKKRMDAALRFLKYLLSVKVQNRVTNATGHLPVIEILLDRPHYKNDPHFGVLYDAELRGRRLPHSVIWGQIEDSLSNACFSIWKRIKQRGNVEIDDFVKQQLNPIVSRFDPLLAMFGKTKGESLSPQQPLA